MTLESLLSNQVCVQTLTARGRMHIPFNAFQQHSGAKVGDAKHVAWSLKVPVLALASKCVCTALLSVHLIGNVHAVMQLGSAPLPAICRHKLFCVSFLLLSQNVCLNLRYIASFCKPAMPRSLRIALSDLLFPFAFLRGLQELPC